MRNVRIVDFTGDIVLAFHDGHVVIRKSDHMSKKDVAEALIAVLNRIAMDPDLGLDVVSMSIDPDDRAQLDLLENPNAS